MSADDMDVSTKENHEQPETQLVLDLPPDEKAGSSAVEGLKIDGDGDIGGGDSDAPIVPAAVPRSDRCYESGRGSSSSAAFLQVKCQVKKCDLMVTKIPTRSAPQDFPL